MIMIRLPVFERLKVIKKRLIRLYGDWVVTNSFNNCTVDTAVKASSPVVGSSKNRTLGSMTSSMPISVLFLSPPLIPLLYSVPT